MKCPGEAWVPFIHPTIAMTSERLNWIARQVVEHVQRQLPNGVKAAAASVPVCYEPHPNADLLADGLEPDILGLFVGLEHLGNLGEGEFLPPQILLFIENIWDLADGDETAYRDEVRLTYLHELGHFLGWDEDEIARQGLE
jgi:predicted Zn-dependent protease with MMP-like domain